VKAKTLTGVLLCVSATVVAALPKAAVLDAHKVEVQAQPSGKAELATDDTFVSDARMKIGWGGISSLELNRE
jgi:hypothetical protein